MMKNSPRPCPLELSRKKCKCKGLLLLLRIINITNDMLCLFMHPIIMRQFIFSFGWHDNLM